MNGIQIFGNNEYYPEWIEFVESQGIEVGEEGQYDGVLTDFMGAVDACERIVLRLDDERREQREELRKHGRRDAESEQWIEERYPSLFDLTGIRRKLGKETRPECRTHLFDELYDLVNDGYLFIPIALFNACREHLEPDVRHPDRILAYRLKEGCSIPVHAG